MNGRLRFLFVLSVPFVLFAPAAFAVQDWCAPEYGSCTGGDSGDTSTFGGPGGSGSSIRDGDLTYGADYDYCFPSTSNFQQSCYSCQFVPTRNAAMCTVVTHSTGSYGSCKCTETYSNYILTSCRVYG